MKRIELFEFEDLSWFPDTVRQGGTDFLRFFLNATGFYNVCVPVLADLLQKAGDNTILDLCSGGGGAMESIVRELDKRSGIPARIFLSDKFPNLNAFTYLQTRSNKRIGFIPEPVDALDVPAGIPGVLTMFSAIHHFDPATIEQMVRKAAEQKRGLAFFDGGSGNVLSIPGIVLLQPIMFAIFTPFFRPFKLSRLFFTYVLPAIPLMTAWDGVVSMLRLYKPEELLAIAKKAAPEYVFEAGKIKNRLGFYVTFLTGRPG